MRKENRLILFIIFLGLLLRLVNLNQSFWLDEAAQVIESSRSFSQQFDIPADFHPPLYHLILHFWLFLGKSEIWIRLPSLIFGIGSVMLTYKLASILVGREIGLLASFLLAIAPYHIWYSQEARPYMLFVFLSLLSTYLLVKQNWWFYTVSIILLIYSLYFAPFVIFGHLIYVYFKEKRRLPILLKTVGIGLLFFLPWLPSFFNQLKAGLGGFFIGWQDVVSVTSLKLIPLTLAKFVYGRGSIENNFIYSLILLPEVLIFFVSLYQIQKKKGENYILVFFLVPFLTTFLISFVIPIVAPQRLIFLLPFFYLILASGILKLSKVYRIVCIAIVIITTLLGTYDYFTNPYTQREQWRQATEFVEKDTGTLALFVFPEPFAPYIWYQKNKIEAIGIAPKFRIVKEDLERVEKKVSSHQKVYLFQYLTGLTDPDRESWEFLEQKGYQEVLIKDFPGVGFIYVFEKYDTD